MRCNSIHNITHTQEDAKYKSPNFAVLYYKNNGSIGIREKKGFGSQIFSFGSGSGLTKTELQAWGRRVTKKIDNKVFANFEAAKAWIDERMRAL